MVANLDSSLPLFRQDLKLYRAPDEVSGAPSYSLYDPVRAQYYQITWEQSLVFRRFQPGMSARQLAKAINESSPAQVSPQELVEFWHDAARRHLLRKPMSGEQLLQESRQEQGWLQWLLGHYLYFRIPIWNPDRFLQRTLPVARAFVSPWAWGVYLLAIMVGLFQVVPRFQEFIHTFSYFFNLRGALAYALALSGTKIIHELAHAYTAKNYGVRVPTMGIAFLVFWPVLYTDISDAWKLSDRKPRLAISIAGIAAEMIIAGICTLGWAVSPPGIVHSIFFIVASAMWVTTILINANPAMRFDGYYVLSDWWGIDNLQERAFALTRWQLRRWILGLDVPPPEPVTPHTPFWRLIAYSLFAWIYRIFLSVAIATLVYNTFTKALGIFLFFFGIVMFFVRPIVSELQQMKRYGRQLKANRRMNVSMVVVGALLAWLFLPLPHAVRFSAVVEPVRDQVLYAPFPAQVEEILVQRGETVSQGQELFRLSSERLASEIRRAEVEGELLEQKVKILENSKEKRAFLPEHVAQLAAAKARLAALHKLQERLGIRATVDGVVYMLDDTVRVGQSVAVDQALGRVGLLTEMEVLFYLPERYADLVQEGDVLEFQIAPGFEKVEGTVTYSSPTRVHTLRHPQLSSTNQGDLPVQVGNDDNLVLVESYYLVRMRLKQQPEQPLRAGQTGWVMMTGPWRSLAMEGVRRFFSVLIRESGF